MVAIEKLKVGDAIYAYDQTSFALIESKVSQVFQREVGAYLHLQTASGIQVKATGEHPFYSPTSKSFKELKTFSVGDKVWVYNNGSWETDTIIKLDYQAISTKVYNLEVADANHTYIAEKIAVHNKTIGYEPVSVAFNIVPVTTYGNIRINDYGGTLLTLDTTFSFYPNGAQQISAEPADGKIFVSWSGSVTSTDNPLTFTPVNGMTITANFADE